MFTGEETTRKTLAVKMLCDKWKPFHELIAAVSKACNVNPFEIAPAFMMNMLLNECKFAKEHGILVDLEDYGKKAQEELDKVEVNEDAAELTSMLQEIKKMLRDLGKDEPDEPDEEE